MIQVAQLNFREMEHQICLLGMNQTISGLLYAGGMDVCWRTGMSIRKAVSLLKSSLLQKWRGTRSFLFREFRI